MTYEQMQAELLDHIQNIRDIMVEGSDIPGTKKTKITAELDSLASIADDLYPN